ncbi:MAG TPA: hypothetical protein VFO41_13760 [Alphaproteobacteria bacterium]|nr:hypothetical protein [Alphaproteobacteria bacterium]
MTARDSLSAALHDHIEPAAHAVERRIATATPAAGAEIGSTLRRGITDGCCDDGRRAQQPEQHRFLPHA